MDFVVVVKELFFILVWRGRDARSVLARQRVGRRGHAAGLRAVAAKNEIRKLFILNGLWRRLLNLLRRRSAIFVPPFRQSAAAKKERKKYTFFR